MLSPRVIPTLLLKDMGLVKGVRFKDHKYVGDPMNAVRIFNSKNADELFLLDITALARGTGPDPEFVQRVADECHMPFGVGGGIRTVEQIGRLVRSGAEKVAINTAALARPEFIGEAAASFGSQCVVVSIDVGRDLFGRPKVFSHNGSRKTSGIPLTGRGVPRNWVRARFCSRPSRTRVVAMATISSWSAPLRTRFPCR